jgi:hypothetical protein
MLQPYSNVIESAREQNQPIEPRSTPSYRGRGLKLVTRGRGLVV